jgi:hypothetical protein
MKCPIGCAYCMADLVPARRDAWARAGRESIGLNKSATFLNRLPGGRPLRDWAPLDLLDGDTVGFQGIQDPLDPRWEEDVLWLLSHADRFGGVMLTTKWPSIRLHVAQAIASAPDAVLVVSLTGLNDLEPGSRTEDRIRVAELVASLGGRVHGLVHPWIPGRSHVRWLPAAREAGISSFTVKGFRWSRLMPFAAPSTAHAEREGEEVLVDPPDLPSVELPRFRGQLDRESATRLVDGLLTTAVVSSSDDTAAVREAAINRRMRADRRTRFFGALLAEGSEGNKET